jgi:hypothetical protein
LRTLSGESFEVRREENNSTVVFKGALRLSGTAEYEPILDMLKETLVTPNTPILLDLRELDFLNSSGITMFSRFVIEARDCAGIQLEILASEAVPWHTRSLKNLQRLMPALSIRLA